MKNGLRMWKLGYEKWLGCLEIGLNMFEMA